MFSVDEEATVVGVAELRNMGPKILKALKEKRIILTRRNEPAAVMLSIEEFQRLKAMAEEGEDLCLEHIAHQRDRTGKKNDYLSHKEVKAKLGL